MAVNAIDVRFDRRRNSREHQLAVMPDAPHQVGRHFDERAWQHVGQDQRPRSRHRLGPAARQLQPLVEPVDARVLRGDAQRLVFDVDALLPRHTHQQRREREYSRPCADVEPSRRRADVEGFFEGFETHRGRRVEPRAERRGIDEPEGAGLRLGARRNNVQAADANRAWAEHPDGISFTPQGRQDRHTAGGNAECFTDLIWCDVVGHQSGDAAIERELGIKRTELD